MVRIIVHLVKGIPYTLPFKTVPDARNLINKKLNSYIELENRRNDFLFDISIEDTEPEEDSYSIQVSKLDEYGDIYWETIWTNKNLI